MQIEKIKETDIEKNLYKQKDNPLTNISFFFGYVVP